MGRSVRDRLQVVTPADLKAPMVPLNPLYVRKTDAMSHHAYQARLSVRSRHTARMVAACSGVRDFLEKPLLEKWLTLVCRGLASMGLPLAEAVHFVTPGTDLLTDMSEIDNGNLGPLLSMMDSQ